MLTVCTRLLKSVTQETQFLKHVVRVTLQWRGTKICPAQENSRSIAAPLSMQHCTSKMDALSAETASMLFFFWKSVGDDDDVPVFSDGGSGRGID